MKIILKLLALLWCTSLLAGCTEELSDDRSSTPDNSTSDNQVTFSLGAVRGEIDENNSSTRASEETVIRQLKYVILDNQDKIITPKWQTLEPDFSFLALEGLKDGDYSAVFFATTNPDATITTPQIKNGELQLENPSSTLPLDKDYLYNRLDFNVSKQNGSRNIDVPLKRCVGRVEVEVKPFYAYSENQIQKIKISLDDKSSLYSSRRSKKGMSYQGSGTITDFDVTKERGFYSLPSDGPVSGSVVVESIREDSVLVSNVYNFSNITIEEGKITRIKIDWKTPNGNKGLFHVLTSDLTDKNMSTMFLDSEPTSTIYNASLRSFTTNKPLQVRIDKKDLHMKFYSPITLTDVTIMCRFRKYSPEFFKLVHFQTIPGFSEIRLRIPVVDMPLTYQSEDGRNLIIPAQPNLQDADCELRIDTPHPYMARVATITHPISVSFSPFAANEGHHYWRNWKPITCRKACVLIVNQSFMLSSKYFEDLVTNWTGNPFHNGAPLTPEVVIAKARGVTNLVMGVINNAGGLAGGNSYGLNEYCYNEQYWHIGPKNSYVKETIFHEFGHCMGYGHESSMTYGDAWSAVGQDMIEHFGRSGLLPVSNEDWDSNYK